ncbi:MAG TPA: VIT and VWA domain-containing protein [Fimbriimonas sp.]|nr:VIT and VWA domain-containing protein [Fimbriimonas sp.]
MLAATLAFLLTTSQRPQPQDFNPGQLTIEGPKGEVPMPLKHTDVHAQISGFGAEVTVDQTFRNPSSVPVEAIYTFPLPHDAAVNAMRIKIGDRVIEGSIKPRDQARAIYDAAKNAGQSAALLDQERPNIFTQSVANIMPGKAIDVEIRYVQVLKYEQGSFEFSFPMVVGPRYTNETTADRNKIVPPFTPEGTRTGQTIDLSVDLNAGAPIEDIHSVLHKTDIQLLDPSHARISLDHGDRIPNKDFLLRYQLATRSVQSAVLSHYDPEKGGFFALLLMPPKAPKPEQIDRREFIFVMDQSGSQDGQPIEKSKELTIKIIKTMRPGDTFNVLGFNTIVRKLWPKARPYNAETLKEAEDFLNPMVGNGGTEIAAGVLAALDPPTDPERLRMVVFNTDGYVGEEKTILSEIRTHRRNSRMFTFGIGNSVNHYLIDAMSDEGKGASETVTLGEPTDEKVARFVARTRTPILTDVAVQFKGLEVSDTLPREIPDVFDETPVVVFGRYANPGKGEVVLQGNLGGKPWSQTVDLNLSDHASAPAIESLWARQKVERLDRDDWAESLGMDRMAPKAALKKVALEFGIMSSETSFVAVEKKIVNVGGKQISVRVPIERVEGVGPLAYPEAVGKVVAQGFTHFGAPTVSAGGGFGGSGVVPSGVNYVGYSSSDNSLVVQQGGLKTGAGRGASKPNQNKNQIVGIVHPRTGDPSPEMIAAGLHKIDKDLVSAKGSVSIEILVNKLSDGNIKILKELGFKIDDTERGLKALFGTCDAEKLRRIAALEFVQKIVRI